MDNITRNDLNCKLSIIYLKFQNTLKRDTNCAQTHPSETDLYLTWH